MKKNNVEERKINVEDFLDILALRTCLVYESLEEIKEDIGDDIDIFIYILHQMNLLIDIDHGGFAVLDEEIIDKIMKVINLKRFEIKNTHPEEFQLINQMIIKLNKLKSLPSYYKEFFKYEYLKNQSKNRSLYFNNYQSLLESIGIDSIVFDYLQGEELDEDIPNEYLIGSLMYLKNAIPNLFTIDEVKERSEELFDYLEQTSNEILLKRKTEKIRNKILKR